MMRAGPWRNDEDVRRHPQSLLARILLVFSCRDEAAVVEKPTYLLWDGRLSL